MPESKNRARYAACDRQLASELATVWTAIEIVRREDRALILAEEALQPASQGSAGGPDKLDAENVLEPTGRLSDHDASKPTITRRRSEEGHRRHRAEVRDHVRSVRRI